MDPLQKLDELLREFAVKSEFASPGACSLCGRQHSITIPDGNAGTCTKDIIATPENVTLLLGMRRGLEARVAILIRDIERAREALAQTNENLRRANSRLASLQEGT